MKTLLTLTAFLISSTLFAQDSLSLVPKDSTIWTLLNLDLSHFARDTTRWANELKEGLITDADFQTLKVGDEDLIKLDSTDSAFEAGTYRETLEMVHLKYSGIAQSRSFFYPFFHQFVTKPVIEKEDVIIYGLQFLAGLADGVNQAVVYHGALSKYPFWNYQTSWKRKYKNYPTDQRAAFPGAKTWAVGVTDGNHLTRGINRGASLVSVAIAMQEHDKWYEIVKEAIISSLINRAAFSLMYDHILK